VLKAWEVHRSGEKTKSGAEEVSEKKKILVVGGVAGGASCAARARRMSEAAEIIILERGPYVSFANCGLPYYVGNVIKEEEHLLVATPELFRERFNIEVRVENEVLSIDRFKRQIEVRDRKSHRIYRESYTALVLAPGSAPVRPPLPGIDMDGVLALRTIPDSRQIRQWIEERKAKCAVVVGGGFIGLEMTENLANRGLSVTIVEASNHLIPPIDPEMASPLHNHLITKRVALNLGQAVTGFELNPDGRIAVCTATGAKHMGDLVILAIGVQPEAGLARAAGIEIGERGGIRVDDQMRTSDKHIWAVGDAIEVKDFVIGQWTTLPLAGPANRQGRIAADVILGRDARFRGTQGTAICKVFDLTVAVTGACEKNLKRCGIGDKPAKYEKIYLHPGHHAGYYPGAKPISIKLIFSTEDGKILGAQAIGEEGVAKRIDVIATLIQMGATVFDLEEVELCYAPQYGSAKDPVNIAGMIAANVLRGDAPLVHWDKVNPGRQTILDVRDPEEFKADHLEGADNIPLGQLRRRIGELNRDSEILTYCAVGQRSYYASRALRQYGFNAQNISGGYKSLVAYESSGMGPVQE
jgi:NADPH-dependent 2,4-dienoyl-CoA reductase/sulfur reductase-like enzyme/rhodanese-related sulfurtransferase